MIPHYDNGGWNAWGAQWQDRPRDPNAYLLTRLEMLRAAYVDARARANDASARLSVREVGMERRRIRALVTEILSEEVAA